MILEIQAPAICKAISFRREVPVAHVSAESANELIHALGQLGLAQETMSSESRELEMIEDQAVSIADRVRTELANEPA